jgi:hypothetical protein
MRISIALFSLALASSNAHAEFSSGLGIFSHNINRTTKTNDAKTSLLGTNFFPITARYQTQPLWNNFRLAPYLQFSYLTTLLIKNETPDGSAERNYAIIGSPILCPLGPKWFLSGGPSFMYYQLKGKGGTTVLNNGTGTSTFGVPSKTRTSKLLLLELGTGWQVDQFRINVDLYLSGLASDRLAMSFFAGISYNLGGYR